MARRKVGPVSGAPEARVAILRGAARAFSEKGYRGTTMQDIAAAAGYTPPTLYSYFDGKDDILRSLVDDLTSELLAGFDAPMADDLDFAGRLAGLLDRHREVAEARREAFVFLMTMRPSGDGAALDEVSKDRTYHRRMVRWMRDAQKETGELGDVPATVMATALMSLFEGFLCEWADKGGRRSLAALVKQVEALFLHGVHGEA